MTGILKQGAQEHLGNLLGVAGFRIVTADPISGNGLSRNVIKLVATSTAAPEPVAYVLLIGQPHSPVTANWDAEFGILRALAAVPAIAVPRAYAIEHDPAPLGAPFLVIELLPGTTNPKKLLEPDYAPRARQLIEQSFETLGALAAVDVASLALGPALPVPCQGDAARAELQRCEQIITASGCDSQVVTHAALRFLHRKVPPPSAMPAIVHGDYRLGNYLFDRAGLIGIIDWEMAHVGDPLEDLAWSLLPMWEFGERPGLVGGAISRAEAIAAWQRGSGLAVDAAALHWWTVCANIKAVSLWATARHQFASDPDADFMPGLIGYALIEKQEADMAELLHRKAA